MNLEKSSVNFFRTYWLIAAVLVSGLMAGLLGVGGGVFLVPSLVVFAGLKQRLAHGTSLVAICIESGFALLGYLIEGSVNYLAGPFIIIGAWFGVWVGTHLLNSIPIKYLKLIFGAFACVVAVRLFVGLEGTKEDVALTLVLALGCVALGLCSGFLSGLLGIGGGIVIVPILILLFDFVGIEARGTSLMVIFPTALMGTYRNIKFQNADLHLGLIMGVFGAATAILGAFISPHISERFITILFGCLLTIIAGKMFWDYFKWNEEKAPQPEQHPQHPPEPRHPEHPEQPEQ